MCAATLNWKIPKYDPDLLIVNGSGLAFFGTGFGTSVAVGSYQDSTFVSNGAGTSQANQCDNNKFINSSSLSVNGAGTILLTELPNQNSTLEINAEFDSAVTLQNWKLYAYDRDNINNAPSGVTLKCASVVHLSNSQAANNGSGNSTWITPAGSGVIHTLLPPSPGLSGTAPNGIGTTSSSHSFYLALSATPTSVGSKTQFGILAIGEYV